MLKRNSDTILLFGLTAIAFLLRVYALGELGFRWDEDLTSITVKAVMEHGYPLLDSGMVYPRFLPLQYLLAGWTSLVGFSEFTIRFPIVLFGTALVPVTYAITRDLVGGRAALVAAAFMALDFWQVELARTARMYAPFFLTYGLFAISVYRGMLWNRRGWLIATLPLGLLTVSLHDIGLFCVALVLVPVVVSREWRYRLFPYAAAAILLSFTIAMVKFAGEMWALSTHEDTASIVIPDVHLAGALQGLLDFLEQFDVLYFPRFAFLDRLLSSYAGAAVWLAMLIASLMMAWRVVRADGWPKRSAALLAVALATMHQYTFAAIFFAVFAGLQLDGIRGLFRSDTIRIALILAVLAVFWAIVAGLTGDLGLERFVKTLLEFPRPRLAMAYPLHRPLMTVFALIGGIAAFDACARREGDQRSGTLIAIFAVSYLPVGMFSTKFSHFRYVLHADVFFMAFAAMGVMLFANYLGGLMRRQAGPGESRFAVPVIAALATLIAVDPARSALAVSRDYVADSPLEKWMELGVWTDFKTPSQFILANRRPTDQVLVLDPREFYNYLGHVDGWVMSHNYEIQVVYWDGHAYDRYIGVPLIHTLDDLKRTIACHDGRTWLPFKRRVLEADGYGGVSPEIAEFFASRDENRVMTGKDDEMLLYLFDGSQQDADSGPGCG